MRRGSAEDKTASLPKPEVERQQQEGGKRLMSLRQGIITVMSLMIGSGIFSNSNEIQRRVGGSPALALGMWFLTGLLSLMGALCYAELGTMIPGSGGEAAYLLKAGRWASSLFDWTSIVIMKPGSLAAISLPFASHLLEAIRRPLGRPVLLSVMADYHLETIAAILMIWIVTLASSVSLRACERVVGVLTYSKLVGLASICLIGLVYFFQHPTVFGNHFRGALSTKLANFSLLKFSAGLNDGLWAFDGWNNLNIVAGELARPSRNLPLAIWISVSVVLGLYMLTMLAYYAVVDDIQFASTSTVAVQFGANTLGKFGAVAMAIMVCLSVFAAALSGMYTSSEIVVLSAKRRFFPRFLERLSPMGTAIPAYLLQGGLATLYVLIPRMISSHAFNSLIMTYTMPTWFFYGACVLLLLVLRYREPRTARPYRVWYSTPVLFLVACLWLIVTTAIDDYVTVSVAFSLVFIGLPIYFWRRKHILP
jgi:amino acid transporter